MRVVAGTVAVLALERPQLGTRGARGVLDQVAAVHLGRLAVLVTERAVVRDQLAEDVALRVHAVIETGRPAKAARGGRERSRRRTVRVGRRRRTALGRGRPATDGPRLFVLLRRRKATAGAVREAAEVAGGRVAVAAAAVAVVVVGRCTVRRTGRGQRQPVERGRQRLDAVERRTASGAGRRVPLRPRVEHVCFSVLQHLKRYEQSRLQSVESSREWPFCKGPFPSGLLELNFFFWGGASSRYISNLSRLYLISETYLNCVVRLKGIGKLKTKLSSRFKLLV